MAKDKDDPDLSPTALADNSGGHQEVTSPPFFNTSSNEKHYKVTDDPVNASKSMTGDHDQQNVASPSSSDANTPNTFSTDEQPKTQPQSDDEILGHAEPANDMSSPDQEETRWALITDPDSGPSHPDLDLTNVDHLTRIIALLQNGWTFSHGRGPRDHQHCLYCRGPIESDIDIFTHVGKTNSCKNSWPASCLMDWMNQALDGERGYRLKCPMCSEEFCNMRQKYGTDFKTNQGKDDPESVLNAAWLRCVLFSPVFAREACLAQGKQLIFMKGSEAKHLVFLGKEKAIFHECEGLMNPTEMASKAAWLKRHYGDHLPFPIPQLQSMGISQTEATAIAQALSQGQSTQTLEAAADAVHAACENALTHLRAAKAEADSSRPVQIVELDPRFDSTWVIIDRGNNQFLMSPFLTDKVDKWIREPCKLTNRAMKDMTAVEFNALAKDNGGLLAAIRGFEASKDEDITRHRASAEQWLQHTMAKNKPEGVAGPMHVFWQRVKDAYDVKMTFKLGAQEVANDDDWEDEDEDGDAPPG